MEPGREARGAGGATDLKMTGSKWKVSGKARRCETHTSETQQAAASSNYPKVSQGVTCGGLKTPRSWKSASFISTFLSLNLKSGNKIKTFCLNGDESDDDDHN